MAVKYDDRVFSYMGSSDVNQPEWIQLRRCRRGPAPCFWETSIRLHLAMISFYQKTGPGHKCQGQSVLLARRSWVLAAHSRFLVTQAALWFPARVTAAIFFALLPLFTLHLTEVSLYPGLALL